MYVFKDLLLFLDFFCILITYIKHSFTNIRYDRRCLPSILFLETGRICHLLHFCEFHISYSKTYCLWQEFTVPRHHKTELYAVGEGV